MKRDAIVACLQAIAAGERIRLLHRVLGPRLLSLNEVAEHLQLSMATVRRLAAKGDLRVVQIGGNANTVRVHVDDLEALIEKGRR